MLHYNLPHNVVALLDGAPRRQRRLHGLSGRQARKRGTTVRDSVCRIHAPPPWFAAAHPVCAYDVGRPMHLAVFIDANATRTRAAASRVKTAPAAAPAVEETMESRTADELVVARRSFRRACVLRVPPRATLADVKCALREQYGIEGAHYCKLSGAQRLLAVALHPAQDSCPAHPVFAGGDDPLAVW